MELIFVDDICLTCILLTTVLHVIMIADLLNQLPWTSCNKEQSRTSVFFPSSIKCVRNYLISCGMKPSLEKGEDAVMVIKDDFALCASKKNGLSKTCHNPLKITSDNCFGEVKIIC